MLPSFSLPFPSPFFLLPLAARPLPVGASPPPSSSLLLMSRLRFLYALITSPLTTTPRQTASAVFHAHTRVTLSFALFHSGSKVSTNDSSNYLLTSSTVTLQGIVMSNVSWNPYDLSSALSLVQPFSAARIFVRLQCLLIVKEDVNLVVGGSTPSRRFARAPGIPLIA